MARGAALSHELRVPTTLALAVPTILTFQGNPSFANFEAPGYPATLAAKAAIASPLAPGR